MRVLLLNQAFHPDPVATGQYLTDLGLGLVNAGHDVAVITSARGYDDPSLSFPKKERWEGIEIRRISYFRLGKSSRWRRAVDFGSFMAVCAWRLALNRRFDVVVALTSPPLISTLAAWFCRLTGARLVFWVMDLNPDEAIAAGWLRTGSSATRILEWALRQSLKTAHTVVALDRFMQARLIAKSVPDHKLAVIPPWSHDENVRFDTEARLRFRQAHGISEKFVIMYAGNHSPCNPLETLLGAAEQLRDDASIHFCFVGGGSQFLPIQTQVRNMGLGNVTMLPYRPHAELSAVLSSADMHVVTLGDPFVGILHPCKIYNILRMGTPVLYIGPRVSHIQDLVGAPGSPAINRVDHGDVGGAIDAISRARSVPRENVTIPRPPHWSKGVALGKLVQAIENASS